MRRAARALKTFYFLFALALPALQFCHTPYPGTLGQRTCVTLTAPSGGTWTPPAGITLVDVCGCGGGGGGGSGAAGTTGATSQAGGGGGGGAPWGCFSAVPVTPGSALNYVAGPGGATDTDGSDTTLGATLVDFVGASHGGAGSGATGGGGGTSVKGLLSVTTNVPCMGSAGVSTGSSASGRRCPLVFGAASGSSTGAATGGTVTNAGGGAGGAGGSGGLGTGGAAAGGPAGVATGAGTPGNTGTAAAGLTCGGGGGGSAGGNGLTSGGAAGAGGAGGSGKLVICWNPT